MSTLEGHLLLASPALLDPNFAHSVVLLIQHNEQGALGVVINRPTGKTVRELWREVSQTPCDCRRPVHLGGPVSGPLMALHTTPDLAEIEIVAGLYFAAKKQHLDRLVQEDAHVENPAGIDHQPFKIFIGHAGWGPGQLEQELDEGAWQALPADLDYVFAPADDLWERLSAAILSPLADLLKIKHIPADPRVN